MYTCSRSNIHSYPVYKKGCKCILIIHHRTFFILQIEVIEQGPHVFLVAFEPFLACHFVKREVELGDELFFNLERVVAFEDHEDACADTIGPKPRQIIFGRTPYLVTVCANQFGGLNEVEDTHCIEPYSKGEGSILLEIRLKKVPISLYR